MNSAGRAISKKLMNKRQLQKIKSIINYDPSSAEHKRLIRRLKKEYAALPPGKKVNLLDDLKKLFNEE